MTMTLVETITVGSGGASSIEFTGIPQDGKDLVVTFSSRTARVNSVGFVETQINALTSGYSYLYFYGDGSSVTSSSGGGNSWRWIYTNGDDSTSNTFGSAQLYFSNYSSSNAKSVSVDSVGENNATAARAILSANSHTTTAAITSIKFFETSYNLLEHTTASLYTIS